MNFTWNKHNECVVKNPGHEFNDFILIVSYSENSYYFIIEVGGVGGARLLRSLPKFDTLVKAKVAAELAVYRICRIMQENM